MGHTFSPPSVRVIPPILPDTKGQAYRLFRHYEVQLRGVNVYLYSDGSVTTDYSVPIAGDEMSTVRVPQPIQQFSAQTLAHGVTATGGEQPPLGNWLPNVEGPMPYAEVYDVLVDPPYVIYQADPYCISYFRGGCGPYQISDAMYALLNAAGFGAYCT